MTTKAFNQYISMYMAEHPISDALRVKYQIQETFATMTSIPTLHIDNIFPSDNNIVLSIHPFMVNELVKEHSHDFFELIYLSKGTCQQTIEQKICNISEGDIYLLNPNISHSVSVGTEQDLLFNIMIKPELFNAFFLYSIEGTDLIRTFFVNSLFTATQEKSYLYFPRSENNVCSTLIQQLILELLEKKLGYQKAAENYLALLFTELTRTWQRQIDRNVQEMNRNEGQITEIINYINTHKNNVTLNSVADHFHYHPKYLSSLIRKYTNRSFSDILKDAKLQEICYYLKYTNLIIDEIAEKAGYSDRSYFNRMFKKSFHMTPVQYRELNKIKKQTQFV